MTNREIRAKARQDLGGKIFSEVWLTALAASLVYSLLISAISAIPVVGQIASILLAGPLLLGISSFYLGLARGGKPTIGDIFNGFDDFTNVFMLNLIMGIFVFLWSLLFIIPGIVKSYAYSMAYYIKRDNPSYSWKQCLDESQRIMKGHKADLFCLHLSFIGWEFVCCLTFGIGFLWLTPYIMTSNANFYESITSRDNGYYEEGFFQTSGNF